MKWDNEMTSHHVPVGHHYESSALAWRPTLPPSGHEWCSTQLNVWARSVCNDLRIGGDLTECVSFISITLIVQIWGADGG